MCGLAGVLGYAANNIDVLRGMSDRMIDRGPDASGHWWDAAAGIGLAHRRLSIQDLSEAGHQPMESHSGRFVIAFNGEIYNHIEMRGKLESTSWRGHSDTETLLECIAEWGVKHSIQAITGMFSIALWDRQERQLYLARDRIGEKPLYFGWQSRGGKAAFLFASTLAAMKTHPSFEARIDRDALNQFVRFGYVPSPCSIYKGIRKLQPGHLLRIGLDNHVPSIEDYWNFRDLTKQAGEIEGRDDIKQTDYVDQMEFMISQSISQQMIADVPLGAFLSGGIDSSTVVALMQKQSSRPVKTFTIGFEQDQWNEAKYAKKIAAHLGTEHTEHYVSSQDALDVIPQLAVIYDEPFGDSSQIPTFLLSKMTRQDVTVALSGDGGDEIFCGYNRYMMTRKVWAYLKLVPQPMRRVVSRLILNVNPQSWDRAISLFRANRSGDPRLLGTGDRIHKAAALLPSSDIDQLYQLLVSLWVNSSQVVIGANEIESTLSNSSQEFAWLGQVEKMMALDTLTYLPGDILTKVDKAAMASSLETRLPFLDHRIIETAWKIPLSIRLNQGKSKWLLREILHRHVPSELYERPKMGFGIPLEGWLRGPLREWGEDLLEPMKLRNSGYLNHEIVRKKWEEHISGKRNWAYGLWNVLMFQSWLDQGGDSCAPEL